MGHSLCCTLSAACAYKIFSTYKIIRIMLPSPLLDQKLGPTENSNFKKCLILSVKYMKEQMLRFCLADIKVVCATFPSIHLWFFFFFFLSLGNTCSLTWQGPGRFEESYLCPKWQKEQNYIFTPRTFGICNIVQ